MKLRSLCTLVVCGSLVGCGGGSSAPPDDTGTETTSGAGGTTETTGGNATGSGGANATTGAGGGATGTGGGAMTGTCAMPSTYTGPALMTGQWVDVTELLKASTASGLFPRPTKILAGVNGSELFAYTAAGKTWTQLAGAKGTTVSQVVFVSVQRRSLLDRSARCRRRRVCDRRWRRDGEEARYDGRRHRRQRRLQGHGRSDDHRRQDDAFAVGRRSGCGLGFH